MDELSVNAVVETIQSVLVVLGALWAASLVAMRAPTYQRPAWAAVALLAVGDVVTVAYRATLRWMLERTPGLADALNVGINVVWGGTRLGALALAVVTAVAASQGRRPPLGWHPPRRRQVSR